MWFQDHATKTHCSQYLSAAPHPTLLEKNPSFVGLWHQVYRFNMSYSIFSEAQIASRDRRKLSYFMHYCDAGIDFGIIVAKVFARIFSQNDETGKKFFLGNYPSIVFFYTVLVKHQAFRGNHLSQNNGCRFHELTIWPFALDFSGLYVGKGCPQSQKNSVVSRTMVILCMHHMTMIPAFSLKDAEVFFLHLRNFAVALLIRNGNLIKPQWLCSVAKFLPTVQFVQPFLARVLKLDTSWWNASNCPNEGSFQLTSTGVSIRDHRVI